MPASPPFDLTPQLLFAVHRSTRDCSRASVSDSSCWSPGPGDRGNSSQVAAGSWQRAESKALSRC